MSGFVDVISLGAGVQSSTLLLMAARGEFEVKPKYAIFSDTGWEPTQVYDYLEWLKGEVAGSGIEVLLTSKGNIREDILSAVTDSSRFASLPFFTLSADGKKGMVRRQCTNEYKIQPVRKKIREILGYKPRQRVRERERVRIWMGISTDEIQRVKPSRDKWIENYYPLIEKDMTRADCLRWIKTNGYPQPPKSSCIGCPFHDDKMWLDMKTHDPESFEDAVFIDREIKKLPRFKGQAFLHRSCKPLDEVDFNPKGRKFDDTDFFINECEGMCGV